MQHFFFSLTFSPSSHWLRQSLSGKFLIVVQNNEIICAFERTFPIEQFLFNFICLSAWRYSIYHPMNGEHHSCFVQSEVVCRAILHFVSCPIQCPAKIKSVYRNSTMLWLWTKYRHSFNVAECILRKWIVQIAPSSGTGVMHSKHIEVFRDIEYINRPLNNALRVI